MDTVVTMTVLLQTARDSVSLILTWNIYARNCSTFFMTLTLTLRLLNISTYRTLQYTLYSLQ